LPCCAAVQVDGDGEEDMEDHFRPAVQPVPSATAFTSTPCGVCPVFADCHEGGDISPQTCIYYDQWLGF
jgi:DNA-directed RNA polymerase III subunit RPC6